MRKLKALFSHNVNPYAELLGTLATNGITTDVALLKETDLNTLSYQTGIARQVLRALQQRVVDLTAAAEEVELLNHPVTRFSTGYSMLDDALYGGYEFGRIIEIYGCTEKAKFVIKTIKAFLIEYPDAIVHHIDTSGTFEPRLIGDQNQQMMTRIYCYEAFTASELHQLLEQISALHITHDDDKKKSLIIINGLIHLFTTTSTTEWDQVTTTNVSDMLCTMASVRKLSLTILMLRTAQVVSDEFSSHQTNKKIIQWWDNCIDLRVHLEQSPQQQQQLQLPPPSYQCDIEKARLPVADTRVLLTEI